MAGASAFASNLNLAFGATAQLGALVLASGTADVNYADVTRGCDLPARGRRRRRGGSGRVDRRFGGLDRDSDRDRCEPPHRRVAGEQRRRWQRRQRRHRNCAVHHDRRRGDRDRDLDGRHGQAEAARPGRGDADDRLLGAGRPGAGRPHLGHHHGLRLDRRPGGRGDADRRCLRRDRRGCRRADVERHGGRVDHAQPRRQLRRCHVPRPSRAIRSARGRRPHQRPTSSSPPPPGPPRDAYTITGTQAGQATTDASVVAPFAAVTLANPNAAAMGTATVVLSAPANGTLSEPRRRHIRRHHLHRLRQHGRLAGRSARAGVHPDRAGDGTGRHRNYGFHADRRRRGAERGRHRRHHLRRRHRRRL